jgi:hypothetical protein
MDMVGGGRHVVVVVVAAAEGDVTRIWKMGLLRGATRRSPSRCCCGTHAEVGRHWDRKGRGGRRGVGSRLVGLVGREGHRSKAFRDNVERVEAAEAAGLMLMHGNEMAAVRSFRGESCENTALLEYYSDCWDCSGVAVAVDPGVVWSTRMCVSGRHHHHPAVERAQHEIGEC